MKKVCSFSLKYLDFSKFDLKVNGLIIKLIFIWNISENKVDFQSFSNILDKVKYLGLNLSIKLLFLNIYSKTQIFANNWFKTLISLQISYIQVIS